MGAVTGQAATLQVEMVCLDELVAAGDRLRRIDAAVDWGFVRAEAAPYYAAEVGRPSIDPIVLVKLMLVGALEGIGSMRELLRVAALRVDIRRFLGYGFCERLPVHQTISHAQTRRFVDAQLFERLVLRSVALCREHGLIDGTHLSVDGFHVEADAALASLRASLEPVADAGERDGGAGAQAPPDDRPQLSLAEPRSGPTPKRRSSNATSTCRSAIPTRSCAASRASGRIWCIRGQVVVDPKGALRGGVPGRAGRWPRGRRARPDRRPGALRLPAAGVGGRRSGLRRRARVGGHGGSRRGSVRAAAAHDAAGRRRAQDRRATRRPGGARALQEPARGVVTQAGMADAEGVVGELKHRHGLDRARTRGTPLFHLQLLLGCTALNLKRLATHAGQATSGSAAGPQTGQVVALDADAGAATAAEGVQWRSITATCSLGTVSPVRFLLGRARPRGVLR